MVELSTLVNSGVKNARRSSVEEDESCTTIQPSLDIITAVKELHVLSLEDLSKLIKDAENFIIKLTKANGWSFAISMESLAKNLGIHLIAHLLSFKRDEEHLRYLLGGLKLLHSLHNLVDRHPKLKKLLLDDVHIGEQMLDLTFFMIIFVSRSGQKIDVSNQMALLHSALLASSFYFLTSFISPLWHELTPVLLVHPKVDVFTGAAFFGVRMVTNFLKLKLPAQNIDARMKSNVDEVHCLFQLAEASLQFLQSLCQKKSFLQRLLINNKELCEEGGVLKLVLDIMKLPRCDDSDLMAVVYRLKSKVLSIMLHLCEEESPSFLDMVSSNSHGLELVKSTIFEVLEVLKMMLCGDLQHHPRGMLQLNAMQLTKLLSDDSSFRPYIIVNLTEVLTQVFSQPKRIFSSTWCSFDGEPAEDITMDFDSLSAAGQVLGLLSTSRVRHSALSSLRAPQIPYGNQISSLLVEILANLTCSVPGLCREGKDFFVNEFLNSLIKEIPGGGAVRTAAVIGNLRSLLNHVGSLAVEFINLEAVYQFGVFINNLEELTSEGSKMHQAEEVHSKTQLSTAKPQRTSADKHDTTGRHEEGAFVDLALVQLNQLTFQENDVAREDQMTKNSQLFLEEEMAKNMQSEKKRKRNKMNEMQIAVIEKALDHEPDMQRKPASLQHWAHQLSSHGSEVTVNQLKNWLNNRKARLARLAACSPSGGDDTLTEKQGGSGPDPIPNSPESPCNEHLAPSAPEQHENTGSVTRICPSFSKLEPGEYVMLVNLKGQEIGRGNIHLSRGIWFEKNLEESGLCVVDVTDLMVDKQAKLPYPGDVGTTFAEAEAILGKMRILWDACQILHRIYR